MSVCSCFCNSVCSLHRYKFYALKEESRALMENSECELHIYDPLIWSLLCVAIEKANLFC